ncbi:MAG TPA: hypothetical protein VN612_04445 [Acidobacteriaceae bacterium]|nr:hypothetical protein [Acidobacteriaceae bacterium]
MSYPRTTDVSRHLARKVHLSIVPRTEAEAVAAAEQARTDLNSLSEDLSAAVNSAHSASTKDGKQ